jgi:hypothetical protein
MQRKKINTFNELFYTLIIPFKRLKWSVILEDFQINSNITNLILPK